MKFIHTADLHLDSPFNNLKGGQMPADLWNLIYESTYRSFRRVVDAAIQQRVDLVLIVGDLFDRPTRSIKAQSFLKRCFEKLNRHRIPVYLSFGNHDYYDGDYRGLRYPKNTYVFPAKVTTRIFHLKNGQRVGITGFSYRKRWESQRMIDQFQPKRGVDYQIGMIHGQVSSGDSNYAPFSLAELKAKHYDYWALGHVHKRQALCRRPPVWYCGNIQGRNPNETGEKGYLLVDSKNHFQPEFKATSVIDWRTLRMKISSTVMNEAQLVAKIMTFLDRQQFPKLNLIELDLKFKSRSEVPNTLLTLIRNGNVLDQIQGKLAVRYRQMKVWVYRLKIFMPRHASRIVNLDRDYWRDSGRHVFGLANVDRLANKLFQYSFLNRHFNSRSAIRQLRQQARQLIQDRGVNDHDN